jgi:hypothetical protein
MLLPQIMERAVRRAAPSDGSRIEINRAMIAIATSSSISVNPVDGFRPLVFIPDSLPSRPFSWTLLLTDLV